MNIVQPASLFQHWRCRPKWILLFLSPSSYHWCCSTSTKPFWNLDHIMRHPFETTMEDSTNALGVSCGQKFHFSVLSRGGHTIDFRNILQIGQQHLYREDYVVHILKNKTFQQRQSEKKFQLKTCWSGTAFNLVTAAATWRMCPGWANKILRKYRLENI